MLPQHERYIRDHQEQLMKEAEQHRMSQHQVAAPSGLGQRLATSLGDLLINAGTQLKSHYAEAEEQLSSLYPTPEPLSEQRF